MAARYQLIRRLGHGGMGVVDLVHDTVRDQVVARKRMLADSADARLLFKREFRAVESLRHPGIVMLHALEEDEEGPFFTMEYVRGVDLRRYCNPGAPPDAAVAASIATRRWSIDQDAVTTRMIAGAPDPAGTSPVGPLGPAGGPAGGPAVDIDEERLDATLAQLIEALRFLHGAGVVHRDLKPSNVLVRDDGRVKVLDFGLAIEAVPWESMPPSFAGTPAYMAPEQVWGQRSGPAADAYALGAMLFETVTGRLPFIGPDIVRAHLGVKPPRADTVHPGVPRRYADACERLLQKDPAARPTLEELEVILQLARTPRFASARERALVGRETIQRTLELRLHRAHGGAFAIASLVGPTGIGRTALLDWLAQEAAREGGVVLRGRARVTEHIAFNALDGAIDRLARVLRAAADTPARGEALSIAGSMFPVLPVLPVPDGAARVPATRKAVFAAIVELVRGVAAASPVTLLVDDVQWADADSLALLEELVQQAPGRTLVVAACRDDVGETAGVAWARRHGGDILVVAPLPAAVVSALVVRHVREQASAAAISELTLARVVAQCDGRPVLAELAARELASGAAHLAGDVDLAGALVARVRAAPPPTRRLLAVLAAAERSTGEVFLRTVSALSPSELTDALARLQHEALVVSAVTPRGDTAIELAHDVVRTAVLEGTDPAELRAAHDAWADALALDFDWDPAGLFRRVHHLVAAGRLDEAAPLAADAAPAAARHGAFGLAADLYAIALRVPHADAAPLLRARALALMDAGRHPEAAAAWRAYHDAATSPEDRLHAAVWEAQVLLATSDISAGLERLDAALAAAGEPSARAVGLRGALSLARFLQGPRGRLALDVVATPEEIEHAELAVRTTQALMFTDLLASHRMFQRLQARALERGLAEIAAWCDYIFSATAQVLAHRAGPSSLADRYRRRGDLLLRGASPRNVEVLVNRGMSEYWGALREARWQECVAIVEREISRLEQRGLSGGFSHLFCISQRVVVDNLRTDFLSHARQVARLRAAARGVATGGLAFHVEVSFADAMLLRGDFDEAYAAISGQLETWPEGTFQRHLALGCLSFYALAAGQLPRAHAHALALDAPTRLRIVRTLYGGFIAARLAALEAACLRAGIAGASARRLRALTQIAHHAPPLGLPLALRAEASLAQHEGDPGGARWLLLRAEREAERLAMPFDVARARYQRGQLLGAVGAALVASARDLAASVGASERVLDRLP
ncbi:MAG TPA: serine/threonine-protein kinase [Kofleriaceae bacterium]|nr:serine/threonine-protein kinase [Kofleriaceae bacterium]